MALIKKIMKKARVTEEFSLYNSIQMLNWAWIIENENNQWEQLDCLTCMALESKWQAWLKEKSIEFDLSIGTIKYATMTVEKKTKDGLE